ncbi:hypothetical protein FACS1894178_6330 [Bacteroidia bacterium]|nr:hypothetical protein FACS1894178_6330 [Bacteroidia bacterium]
MDMELSTVKNLIYEIRDKKVMLDFDLAMIYCIKTKRLKEQVRRNIERFPPDFMFQVTEIEWQQLVANCDRLPKTLKHSSVLPNAFTQEGVAMLSGILHTPIAVEVNIRIMRAFVMMRTAIAEYSSLNKEIAELWQQVKILELQDKENLSAIQKDLAEIYQVIAELTEQKALYDKPRRPIGFGVKYDDV